MSYTFNPNAYTLILAATLANPTLMTENDEDQSALLDASTIDGLKRWWRGAVDMLATTRPDVLIHGDRDDCIEEMLKDKDIVAYLVNGDAHPTLSNWTMFA